MVKRLVKPSKSNSFFVFGPRGSGKSTWLRRNFLGEGHSNFYINLLLPRQEDRYRTNPESLRSEIIAGRYEWVIIDEIQKLPKLLDLVHELIEERSQKFILTGSSARKLKAGAANLLAGRAFVYYLYPFSALELGDAFDLDSALNWGLLPKLLHLATDEDRIDFLESHCLTYLKEEIQQEQIVRRLDPFRNFLEVAAQMNGKLINFSKIAREIGVDTTTVQNYYSILEDTLIGFHLNAFHTSIRKRILAAPKFYFFDPGAVRALSRTLESRVVPGTAAFGHAFEHFVILEIWKRAHYFKKNWRFSYLLTKDGVEIDLILDGGKRDLICIKIKSADHVHEKDLTAFAAITSDLKSRATYCLSRDPIPKQIGHIRCLHWRDGLSELFKTDDKKS